MSDNIFLYEVYYNLLHLELGFHLGEKRKETTEQKLDFIIFERGNEVLWSVTRMLGTKGETERDQDVSTEKML